MKIGEKQYFALVRLQNQFDRLWNVRIPVEQLVMIEQSAKWLKQLADVHSKKKNDDIKEEHVRLAKI